MSETADTDDPTEGWHEVEVIEFVTRDVDSVGNTILDDTVFVVDTGGTIIAKDETITFETPEGDIIASALGDDGQMHLIDEDVTVKRWFTWIWVGAAVMTGRGETRYDG